MTTNTRPTTASTAPTGMDESVREGVRQASLIWWWYLIAGIAWTWYGMFVLSYRPESLTAVAVLVGLAFLFGGLGEMLMATRVASYRWLHILAGILALGAGIVTFIWPDITLYVVSIFVAWYLVVFGIVHVVSALESPKVSWWWSQLLLGIGELVLGVWALRSYEGSLLTFMTLVGVWAIIFGVAEIFAAFALHDEGKRLDQLDHLAGSRP